MLWFKRSGLAACCMAAAAIGAFEVGVAPQDVCAQQLVIVTRAPEFRRRELMVVNVDGAGLRAVPASDQQTYGSPAWSPDGKWIACDSWRRGERFGDSHLLVMRADGSEVRDIGPGAMPSWSPDGRQLTAHTYDDGGAMLVMNVDGSGRVAIVSHWGSPRWSPDGTRIIGVEGGGGITLYDLATAKELRVLGDLSVRHGLSVSPDGTRVCFADNAGALRVATLGEGAEIEEVATLVEGGAFGHCSWSPDGKGIVFAWQRPGSGEKTDIERLYVVDSRGGGGAALVAGLQGLGPCSDPSWSPDGTQILFRRELPAERPTSEPTLRRNSAPRASMKAELRERLMESVRRGAGELVGLRSELDDMAWADVSRRYTTTEAAKLLIAFFRGDGTLPGFGGTAEEARSLSDGLAELRQRRASIAEAFAQVAAMDSQDPQSPLVGAWRLTEVAGAGGLAADALELYDPDPVGRTFIVANGAAMLVTGAGTWLFDATYPEDPQDAEGAIDLSVIVRGDTIYSGLYEVEEGGDRATLRLSVMNRPRPAEIDGEPTDGGFMLQLERGK